MHLRANLGRVGTTGISGGLGVNAVMAGSTPGLLRGQHAKDSNFALGHSERKEGLPRSGGKPGPGKQDSLFLH